MDYDTIYEKFLDFCGYSDSELPKTDTLRYRLIKNGIDTYNERIDASGVDLHKDIKYDDKTESIDTELKSNELLILAYIMCELFSTVKLNEFASLYNVHANEMGIKEYKAQYDAKKAVVENFYNNATKLIENQMNIFSL